MIEDIKPVVAIVDYSYYIFIAIIIAAVIIITSLLFFLFHFKKKNRLKDILQQLQSLSLDDTKNDAYTITFLAKELAVDEQLEQKYQHLIQQLKPYKYKKEVAPFDEDTKAQIAFFLELAGARI